MVSMTITEDFRRLCCSECGVVYFFPEKWVQTAEATGAQKTWQCPNGHGQCFRESTVDKMRRERDLLKQQAARLEEEKRDAQADAQRQREARRIAEDDARRAKAATTRIKKRTRAALCPCCNRSFSQLARHMKSQHPGETTLHAVSDIHAKVNARAAKS